MTGSWTTEERRAAEAVQALPGPDAREAFRARLRAEFVAGTIAEPPSMRRAAVVPLPIRAVLALAAAVAGIFLVMGRGGQWEAMHVPAGGRLELAGKTYEGADLAAWRGSLRPGVEISWSGDEPLALMLPRRLALEIAPGARLTLPRSEPGRRDASRLDVHAGAVQVSTGPRFAGDRLTVHTGPVDVQVVGTTFSVIRAPDFACVCVLEGSVHLRMADGRDMAVPGGERRVVHDDGTVESFGEVEPLERPGLERFREAAARALGGVAP